MSRICTVCDKRPQVVNMVSHANNKVKRWVYPNVHQLRFKYTNDASNKVHAGKVCTKCVKAKKVTKVI